MFLLTVIPISRGIGKEQLSYYSPTPVEVGGLVTIPLRNRTKTALVINHQSVTEAKADLKRRPHSLKKIQEVITQHCLDPITLQAVRETAEWFLTTSGALLYQYSPQTIFSQPAEFFQPLPSPQPVKQVFERFVLQDALTARIEHFRQLSREYFSRSKSVLILTPTQTAAEYLSESVSRGVEDYTYCLHSGLSKSQIQKTWQQTLTQSHPVIIIATIGFLTIPRSDLGILIIDQEADPAYRPATDRSSIPSQFLAEKLAEKRQIHFAVGDLVLRVETVQRYKQGQFNDLSTLSFRVPAQVKTTMVDMKKPVTDSNDQKLSPLISPLLWQILKTAATDERFFLYSARKGLAPILSCQDCGATFQCPDCPGLLSLYGSNFRTNKQPKLICAACGRKEQPFDYCQNCGGTRIDQLGIGTERIFQELRQVLPDRPIYQLDSETATTTKQVRKTLQAYFNQSNSILIGTELAVNHWPFEQTVPYSAVVSMDSLLARPEYSISERVYRLLIRLRSLTAKELLIQTRVPDHPLVELAANSSAREFYQQEIELRKQFRYPPFAVLVKVTIQDRPSITEQVVQHLKEQLADYRPTVYPALDRSRNGSAVNILLRVAPENWPEKYLTEILTSLPRKYIVAVNPDSIL